MKTAQTLALAGVAALAFTGCSGSSSSSPSASPSPAQSTTQPASPTASPSGSATSDACNADAILAALPTGSELVKFDCSDVSGTLWAAAEVNPGPTVFFLQQNGDTWQASTADEVCGTASAGWPEVLLDYCAATSGDGESPS